MDKETIELIEAVLPNLAVVLSITALYIANKVKNTNAVETLTEGEILSPIDMLGMVTTQNSLELSELKQQVEAIGQGVVEIMLNQQMGGM